MTANLTLYVIRHGETDWNAELRYQGQVDIPLNDKGRAQSRRNGLMLATLIPDVTTIDFIASPMIRARETMDIVRDTLHLPRDGYSLDDRLIELSYGSWEGQLQTDLPQFDPAGLIERARDPYRWRPEGGESYADLLARTIDWLSSVKRDTVVVTHGGVSRSLRAHLLSLDPATIPDLESPQDRVLILRRGRMEWK